MAAGELACSRATAAAEEVTKRACEGEEGRMVEVGNDVYVFVRDDDHPDVDVDPDDDREAAIEACMDSEWARDWAASVVGDGATDEAIEAARRRACEGLFE